VKIGRDLECLEEIVVDLTMDLTTYSRKLLVSLRLVVRDEGCGMRGAGKTNMHNESMQLLVYALTPRPSPLTPPISKKL
jgi:hypothetical protein